MSALVGPELRLGLATERLHDQLAFSTNLVDNRLCSYQPIIDFKNKSEWAAIRKVRIVDIPKKALICTNLYEVLQISTNNKFLTKCFSENEYF